MNWIYKYRLNPDWFFSDDELDSEKTNREEIFELRLPVLQTLPVPEL